MINSNVTNIEQEEPQKIKVVWLFVVIFIFIIVGYISNSFLKNTEKEVVESLSKNTIPVLNDISKASNILGDNNKIGSDNNLNNLNNLEKVVVKRVIDGDTIVLDDDRRVRYIGINTPETVHPNKDVECYGKESFDKNKELLEGKTVYLENDVRDVDRYDRILRYVWVDDVMVNKQLVKEGYAFSDSYPPDIKYQDEFRDAEDFARDNEIGLWGECY